MDAFDRHSKNGAENEVFRHFDDPRDYWVRSSRHPGGTIPAWSVDRTGRVDFFRPIRRLTEDEAPALLRRPPTLRPPVRDPEPTRRQRWALVTPAAPPMPRRGSPEHPPSDRRRSARMGRLDRRS